MAVRELVRQIGRGFWSGLDWIYYDRANVLGPAWLAAVLLSGLVLGVAWLCTPPA